MFADIITTIPTDGRLILTREARDSDGCLRRLYVLSFKRDGLARPIWQCISRRSALETAHSWGFQRRRLVDLTRKPRRRGNEA